MTSSRHSQSCQEFLHFSSRRQADVNSVKNNHSTSSFYRATLLPNCPTDCLLRVKLPLYGLSEADLHWFKTYFDHYRNNLEMSSAYHDPYLL